MPMTVNSSRPFSLFGVLVVIAVLCLVSYVIGAVNAPQAPATRTVCVDH